MICKEMHERGIEDLFPREQDYISPTFISYKNI